MRKVALGILLVSSVAFGFVGCGGSTPRKVTTGTAGHAGTNGTAGGTAGQTTGTAGDNGTAGAAGGGTAGSAGGTAGAAGGTAGAAGGTAGAAGGTAGAAGGTAGAAGDNGAAGTAAPPVISSSTAILEIDDVIVALTSSGSTDGGVDGAADGGNDGGVDGGADASADGGVDGAVDAGSSGPAATGVAYTFDTGVGSWHFTSYGSTPPGPPSATNYASTSTLSWAGTDDADGKSTSGSLKGSVPFQHDGDQIDFQAFSLQAGMFNWSGGYTVTAKVKQVSGGNLRQNCPLTAVLYVSEATDYNTTLGPPVNLVPGQWVTVTYDLSTTQINISAVSQLGIQINTGNASACTGPLIGDGGTDAATDGSTTDVPVDSATTTDAAADGGTADAAGDASDASGQ
jgi:hypothetical protein